MCELMKSRIRVRASGRAVKIEGREEDGATLKLELMQAYFLATTMGW
jgi:hypothetical protein